jgi:hypothetical protein
MANFAGELIPHVVSLPQEATFTYTFGLATQSSIIDVMRAISWCDGKRIDLLWSNPTGVTQVRLRRSQYSFCKFVDDPGTDIYLGVPITGYVDGPGPVPSNYPPGSPQSIVPLDENRFYYYTLFLAYETAPPYTWIWTAGGQVEGLSIKDYFSRYGYYVYEWLPRTYKERDGDPTRGADQFKLRDYCFVLQCQVNIFRGWLEGLLLLRDPDLMPAGRLGEALNQTGILQALSWDLGMPPEKSFDAGVLRRIAIGLIAVYKVKGTCPGLVALTKLFATWDSTCDEIITPLCGVDRIFTLWNGTSKINDIVVAASGNNPTLAIGSFTYKTSTLFMADGITPDTVPGTDVGVPTVAFVLDAMGTFACVSTVLDPVAGAQTINFESAGAQLRSSITGSGSGIAGQFSITSVDTTSYPWQFPSPAVPPKFDINAWGGYHLKDSAGNIFPITSSVATTGGATVLNVTGSPASGAFTLALSFDPGTKLPLFWARLYTGEFSLLYDPKWDLRLANQSQPGPFSYMTGLGATTINPAPTPADVIIWVENVANLIGTTTGVSATTVTDSTKTWTINQWAGYYVIPNWDQSTIFRIVGNNATQLTVLVPSNSGGPNSVALAGTVYVILTEENALKYSRLVVLGPSFAPAESRVFWKFL